MKDTPEMDELVIAKVKKIFPYGAFCELEEYPGKEAFIHVSEVAARWIKNIHNFLKEGQRIVGRVYRIIPEKNIIDISIRRVTEADQKRKLESYRREKRARKLLELVYAELKKPKMTLEELWALLEKEYGEVYAALEVASSKGKEAFSKLNLEDKLISSIVKIAEENIKQKKKSISGIFIIQCMAPNGVEIIKDTLMKDKELSFIYLGAPRYMVKIEDEDYKKCEKKMKIVIEKITERIVAAGGTCKFERIKKE